VTQSVRARKTWRTMSRTICTCSVCLMGPLS
jgi:hypothetical protein